MIELNRSRHLKPLTKTWGAWRSVSLYLTRCQVDTPKAIVEASWRHVAILRKTVGRVVDFGAGDGRFACSGSYQTYEGFEIDRDRHTRSHLPASAKLVNSCAFQSEIYDADVCIGNPPFVRNQDLPTGWRQQAASVLEQRLGITISGYANAWQYFFLLAIATLKADGLCVLVIPYEWVSRPSAKPLRDYIAREKWEVQVYRLVDETFDSVATTASITVVDKSKRNGNWSFFEEHADGTFTQLKTPSGAVSGVLPYAPRSVVESQPRAARGLSPGTQKVFVLNEGQRARYGLRIGSDVIRCVTSLKEIPDHLTILDEAAHNRYLRDAGKKCWLIRSDRKLSPRLKAYLRSVPKADYQTSTCLKRAEWWQFTLPEIPVLLVAQTFRGQHPKIVRNDAKVRTVGGVCGIYDLTDAQASKIIRGMRRSNVRERVINYSGGLSKIEISQINGLVSSLLSESKR